MHRVGSASADASRPIWKNASVKRTLRTENQVLIVRPESGGDQLDEVVVRIAEIEARCAAGPRDGALGWHSQSPKVRLPRLDFVVGNREGEGAAGGAGMAGEDPA